MPDQNGYPTEEELRGVREWDYKDARGLAEYLKEIWHWGDFAATLKWPHLVLVTGGWSGNEDIIEALRANLLWWSLYWLVHKSGGYYEFILFDIPDENDDEEAPSPSAVLEEALEMAATDYLPFINVSISHDHIGAQVKAWKDNALIVLTLKSKLASEAPDADGN